MAQDTARSTQTRATPPASVPEQTPATPPASEALEHTAPSLGEAQAFCARLTRGHYENFPVSSWLLPRRLRPAVHAVYAFARGADDFADEPEHREHRLQALDRWERQLEEAARGRASHPIFVALSDVLRRHHLPLQPFRDLLTAFRMDARGGSYDTWEELLSYCRHSANPVGRIMLRLFGQDDSDTVQLSDHLCTALQLTNFWQDLSVDLPRGRSYLPRQDLERFELTVAQLHHGERPSARRELLDLLIRRTHEQYDAARLLPRRVHGPLSWELRAVAAGGRRVLDLVERGRTDPFRARPRLGWRDAVPLAWAMLVPRRRPCA
ncbi:MAG: squalene synthase HpnC [Acidobacteriota bacterium]